jgi:hypothetical protein
MAAQAREQRLGRVAAGLALISAAVCVGGLPSVRAASAPGGAGTRQTVSSLQLQPILDPSFQGASCSGSTCSPDPNWVETPGRGGGYYTVDNDYHTLTAYTGLGGSEYTSDLCGYGGCSDAAYQNFTVPASVSAATLTFDVAAACHLPAGGTCSTSDYAYPLTVELEDLVTQQGDGEEFEFSGYNPPGGPMDVTDMSPVSLDVTSFVMAHQLATMQARMVATTAPDDATEWFVDNVVLTVTVPGFAPSPPTDVAATSTASGQAAVSWVPPPGAIADEDITGYTVTTYNDLGVPVGTPQTVSGGASDLTTITGLTNGTPSFFEVASVNPAGDSAGAPSNSVTPLSGVAPGTAETAVSTKQYHLPNSDGSTWQVMDESNLAFTMTPSSSENVLLSANSDLWTGKSGYNQDLGILVTPSGGSSVLAAWKESGGFAGTYSPNAAFVETVYPMTGGTTYTVQVVWKTNKAAIGATIAAGAGAGPTFSPTRLTADVLPAGAQTAVSTQQYTLPNSNGSSWSAMDATNLKVTLSGAAGEDAVVSGNSDLWTQDAGYNQDLGIFVSVNGGTATLVAWKESGGFAGTFSPNAAYVQAVYPLTAGDTYVFSLEWKTNIPASGAIIEAGAGTSPTFSPTRLTAYEVAAASVVTAVSTQQYLLPNSDGSSWSPMDSTNLVVTVMGSAETVLVSGNADLWTQKATYNQDLGIFVSEDGGTATLLAWKESGGFAGTYSPNAAYVQTVYTMASGHTYVFSLEWKTNIPAPGATIEAAAGGGPTIFSPTRLTVVPQT